MKQKPPKNIWNKNHVPQLQQEFQAKFALELIFAARLVSASVGFVGFVAAIVFAVASEGHPNAMVIGALIFIRLTCQRSAALVGMFVTRSLVAAVC